MRNSATRSTSATDCSSSSSSACWCGWLYWQRDPALRPGCWTKVFGVLSADANVWLFKYERVINARTLLLRLSSILVAECIAHRELRLITNGGGPAMVATHLSLMDRTSLAVWKSSLRDAGTPIVYGCRKPRCRSLNDSIIGEASRQSLPASPLVRLSFSLASVKKEVEAIARHQSVRLIRRLKSIRKIWNERWRVQWKRAL